MRKTYTDSGASRAASGGAGDIVGGRTHVTHMAYLVDSPVASSATVTNTDIDRGCTDKTLTTTNQTKPYREAEVAAISTPPTGFWGVWEPVLGRGGEGVGGVLRRPDNVPGWTTLSRRGGAFRLVPSL